MLIEGGREPGHDDYATGGQLIAFALLLAAIILVPVLMVLLG